MSSLEEAAFINDRTVNRKRRAAGNSGIFSAHYVLSPKFHKKAIPVVCAKTLQAASGFLPAENFINYQYKKRNPTCPKQPI